MPTISSKKITFGASDWLAGLNPQYPSSGYTSYLTKKNNLLKAFNPFRFLGYASPGELPTAATNANLIGGAIPNAVYDKTSNAIYGLDGENLVAKIHKINGTSGAVVDDDNFPYTINHAHTSETSEDIIKYSVGGADYIFYSFNDSTDGDVGRLTLDPFAADDDFMSTIPATEVGGAFILDNDNSHPMIVGDDDVLYIADGNVLKAYDGPNDTVVSSGVSDEGVRAFTIPEKYKINSMIKFSNNTIVILGGDGGFARPGSVRAFFFYYGQPDPYKVLEVFGSEAGTMFNIMGTIGCFSSGVSTNVDGALNNVHMSIFNGQRFELIESINATSSPSYGGVEVVGNCVYFNIDGDLYSYGSPYPGVSSGLQLISGGSGSSSGAVLTYLNTRMLISSGVGVLGGLDLLIENYDSNSAIITANAFPDFSESVTGKITGARVDFKGETTGGRSISIDIYNEKNVKIATLLTNVEDITDTSQYFNISTDGAEFETFNGIHATVTWGDGTDGTDAPIPRKITVYYEQQEL